MKGKALSRIGIVLTVAPLLLLGLHYFTDLLAVHQCVSAGGSFNYSTMSCSFTEYWDYVPYSVRYRWNLNIALGVSLLGLVLSVAGHRKPRGPRIRSYS
jgi:hypothetical protein